MRADFWRYAILYAEGGVYADVDTRCLRGMAHWFEDLSNLPGSIPEAMVGRWPSMRPAYNELGWEGCKAVIGLENGVHFCQWTIATVPAHPVLRRVLEMIVERARLGIHLDHEHFVHEHTGPGGLPRMSCPGHSARASIHGMGGSMEGGGGRSDLAIHIARSTLGKRGSCDCVYVAAAAMLPPLLPSVREPRSTASCRYMEPSGGAYAGPAPHHAVGGSV
jgi:hypothetical protein